MLSRTVPPATLASSSEPHWLVRTGIFPARRESRHEANRGLPPPAIPEKPALLSPRHQLPYRASRSSRIIFVLSPGPAGPSRLTFCQSSSTVILPGDVASSRTAISSPWSDRLWIAALRLSRLTTLSGTFLIESVTVISVLQWFHFGTIITSSHNHASRTATIPVRKIPSKVPAPPIDATGAPRSRSLRRFRRSAPMSVPTTPLMNATASR